MNSTSITMCVVIALVVSNNGSATESTADGAPAKFAGKQNLEYAFTYSLIETDPNRNAVLARIKAGVVPKITKAGATLYAVWTPIPDSDRFLKTAPKTKRVAFIGLKDSQLCLMLAWPSKGVKARNLDASLRAIKGVKNVNTRTYDPIYLATNKNGLGVPTGRGFYVQRESEYPSGNVAEVVRLSKQAWKIFDPYWKTQTIGLFRRRTESNKVAHLLRIVHYPDVKVWRTSHDRSNKAPEVLNCRKIFRERMRLRVPGTRSDAYATDRAVRAAGSEPAAAPEEKMER